MNILYSNWVTAPAAYTKGGWSGEVIPNITHTGLCLPIKSFFGTPDLTAKISVFESPCCPTASGRDRDSTNCCGRNWSVNCRNDFLRADRFALDMQSGQRNFPCLWLQLKTKTQMPTTCVKNILNGTEKWHHDNKTAEQVLKLKYKI